MTSPGTLTSPGALRAAAERYRRMARYVSDPRTVDALKELAAEYEARAIQLEKAPKDDPMNE